MPQTLFRLIAVMLLGGVAAAQQGAAPPSADQPAQPGVTFRAEVNYVEVDARVMDAQGNFVPGLQARDFQVFEDGQPQKISVFTFVNIPVERAERPLFASQPIEPDVQTNVAGYTGRVYLLVLDDLHTHPLRSSRVKAAAKQFIQRYVGVSDMAAVVHTSGRAEATQDFTSNPRLLMAAVDKFMGQKLRSSVMNRIDQELLTRGIRESGERINDPDDAERGYKARMSLDAVKNLADFLGNVRGRRKALLLFSEGVDYDINDPFNNRDAGTVLDASRDAIAAATRGNVAIYSIDARGLTTGLEDAIDITSFPTDTTLGLDSTALQNEVRLGQDSMRVLAEQTGGFAAVNTNDIAGAFERLVDENSSYYVLGYYPENDRRDGRFRRIEVRVNKPGVTVRARRGYVAPRGRPAKAEMAGPNDASVELREAMSSPIPVAGLPLATTASVFKGPDDKGTVVISTLIGGRDLPLVEKDGMFRNEIEIAFSAADAKGKVFPGDRNTVKLDFRPETMARVRAAGFRVITALDLPPGRYQLRVGVTEFNSKRAGSLLYDLEVPTFGKEPLAMSGLALTSATSSVAPTARPKDPLAKLLPGPLTSYREFPQNDEIGVFAEIYDSDARTPHKTEIALTLKAEGGQTVFQTRQERDSSELQGAAGGYGFSARVPLRDVPPGLYVLRVEAQSRIGARPTVGRDVVVRVTPALAPPAPQSAAGTAPGTDMTTLHSGMMSGIHSAEQTVARTAGEWQALWQRHAPGRPLPTVDFARQMVVGVFLGSRTTAGYQVQITGTRRDGAALVVQWTERRPGRDQATAQIITSPAHLVAVPRFDGDVRFEQVDAPAGQPGV